ncbi:histone-lysine N-methyltransferase SUVR2-like protein, partial [Trifolium pratense]
MAPRPNPKIAAALTAMGALGIDEAKVKSVLKKLLKLYDKNWELIEEENYRALLDAIFEEGDNFE